eukprot:8195017-Prorocentrum_lima.AAC.1
MNGAQQLEMFFTRNLEALSDEGQRKLANFLVTEESSCLIGSMCSGTESTWLVVEAYGSAVNRFFGRNLVN